MFNDIVFETCSQQMQQAFSMYVAQMEKDVPPEQMGFALMSLLSSLTGVLYYQNLAQEDTEIFLSLFPMQFRKAIREIEKNGGVITHK